MKKLITIAFIALSTCLLAQTTNVTLSPSQTQGVKRTGNSVSTYQYFSNTWGEVEQDHGFLDPSHEVKYQRYEFSHPTFQNSAMTNVVVNLTYNKTTSVYTSAPGIIQLFAPNISLNNSTSWSSPSQNVLDAINLGTMIYSQGISTPNDGSLWSQTNSYQVNNLSYFTASDTKFTLGFSPLQDGITITGITVTITYTLAPLANYNICCNQSHTGAGASSLITGSTPTGGTGSYAYQWESSPNGSTSWAAISGATGLNYTPPVNLPQTTYYRRKVTSGSTVQYSNVVTVTVNTPATPTGISLIAQSTTSLLMSWTASAGATSYKIYNCATSALVATVNSPATSYTITGLSPATTYQYKINAAFGTLVSAYSSCISATTLNPTPPTQAQISTFAGNGTVGNSLDGSQALSSSLNSAIGLAKDAAGNIYFYESGNYRVKKISPGGLITTVAGTGVYGSSGDNGLAIAARLGNIRSLAFDLLGNLYLGDEYRIRKVNTSGIISTVVGTGVYGYSGDNGPANLAKIGLPYALTFDPSGNLYFIDYTTVRKVNTSGIISTYAGNGQYVTLPVNNMIATSASFMSPSALTSDAAGNIYIADGYVIFKVNTSGYLTRFAGIHPPGFSGDAGLAINAQFGGISSLSSFDANGNLYVADYGNNRIRVINSSGVVTTYAGTGGNGFSGDGGLATNAQVGYLRDLLIDSQNNLFFITDTELSVSRIRVIYKNCYASLKPSVTNQRECCGSACTSVQIGPAPLTGLSFAWSPSTGLDCATCAKPNASPCNVGSSTSYVVTVSGPNCISTQSTVVVQSNNYTGPSCCRMMHNNEELDEELNNNSFLLFPNPCSKELTITSDETIERLKIIDVTGRIVFEQKNTEENTGIIDVSKYNKGIYFIIAQINGRIEKNKFIVE